MVESHERNSQMKWRILMMGVLGVFAGFLSGCKEKVSFYSQQKPTLDLKQYFNGDIQAFGVVQNFQGKVIRRFEVKMTGSWQEDTGTLIEHFIYDDGEKQERTWIIKKVGDNKFEGRAADILDVATGICSGNAMQWKYKMDLKVGNSTYKITFDDWMYLINDTVLINRSYLKKFGITVAELTLCMQKIPAHSTAK